MGSPSRASPCVPRSLPSPGGGSYSWASDSFSAIACRSPGGDRLVLLALAVDQERRHDGHHGRDRDVCDRQPDRPPARAPARDARRKLAQDRGRLTGRAARPRALVREHLFEVAHELVHRPVAGLEVLGRRPFEHGRQRGRYLRAAPLDVRESLAHVLHRDAHVAVAAEGHLSDEHLVQHDPERVDVGLARDVLSHRLLGRDVVGGPDHLAGRGELVRLLGLEPARDAEVGHLRATLFVDQHVLRLHVAVDQPALVGSLERSPDLDRVRDRLRDGQGPLAADAVLEGLTLDVLEDDVRVACRPRRRR